MDIISFRARCVHNTRRQKYPPTKHYELRYPVSTHTYNQYYFIFYLMEVVLSLFTLYAMIIPNFLLISWCWAIIAQQNVLTQTFKSIGHEDNSQNDNILFEIVKYLLKIRVINNLILEIYLKKAFILLMFFFYVSHSF